MEIGGVYDVRIEGISLVDFCETGPLFFVGQISCKIKIKTVRKHGRGIQAFI